MRAGDWTRYDLSRSFSVLDSVISEGYNEAKKREIGASREEEEAVDYPEERDFHVLARADSRVE